MGKRDYGQREQKKQKKDSRKLPPVTISPTTIGVEVIKKGKQKRGGEEE